MSTIEKLVLYWFQTLISIKEKANGKLVLKLQVFQTSCKYFKFVSHLFQLHFLQNKSQTK